MKRALYQSSDLPDQKPPRANTGLWYDKFCNQWCRDSSKRGRDGWSLESFQEKSGSINPKLDWIETVTRVPAGQANELNEVYERRIDLLESQGANLLCFKNSYAFVTGLGRDHPVENGFTWHHTLGVPYLPGSSVKGMVRAWANWCEDEVPKEEIDRIFGPKSSDEPSAEGDEAAVGSVVPLDALPVRPVKLMADIMTPHYAPYYQSEGQIVEPADWHSPIPIPFLVVAAGQSFCFGILPRREKDMEDCRQAEEWLEEALTWIGAGAKTAVGYGRFEIDTDELARLEEIREQRLLKTREQRARTERIEEIKRETSGKSELFGKLFKAVAEGSWREESGREAFLQVGVIEHWLDCLEEDLQPDAVDLMKELLSMHFPKLLEDPNTKKGKKQKYVFKERQRSIAERLLKLSVRK